LGTAQIRVQGYSSPRVEKAFTRAFELSQQVDVSPSTLPVIYNLWTFYLIKADFNKSIKLGNRYSHIAFKSENNADHISAYTILCLNSWYQGEFLEAMEHAQKGLNLHEQSEQPVNIRLSSIESSTTCLAHKSMALWFLGYPDQSQKEMHKALTLAKIHAQPFAIVRILMYSSVIKFLQRDVKETWRFAEQALVLSTEHGFTYYMSHSLVFKGWAEVMQGQVEVGLDLISQGMSNHQSAGAVLIWNFFLAIKAEAYGEVGRIDEGLDLLDEAIALANNETDRFYEAELHRLKGEFLLQKTMESTQELQSIQDEAENCYHQAIKVASQQGAKALELRAYLSLCRMYLQSGEQNGAKKLLERTFEWFTEGFENKDLTEAKLLLKKLKGQYSKVI
jgi:predicted ATPase